MDTSSSMLQVLHKWEGDPTFSNVLAKCSPLASELLQTQEVRVCVNSVANMTRQLAKSTSTLVQARTVELASATKEVAQNRKFQATTAGAAGGTAVLGAAGGAVGLATGTAMGAATGLLFAPFTCGVSIPVSVLFFGSSGLLTGTVAGGAAGAIGGGATGYGIYSHRDGILKGTKFVKGALGAGTEGVVEGVFNAVPMAIRGLGLEELWNSTGRSSSMGLTLLHDRDAAIGLTLLHDRDCAKVLRPMNMEGRDPREGINIVLDCRLLSGRLLSVSLFDVHCMREAHKHIIEAFGVDKFQEVMIVSQGGILEDSSDISKLQDIAQQQCEVTVVIKNVDLVWRPFPPGPMGFGPIDVGFCYRGRAVRQIIRSPGAKSSYVISYCDGGWLPHCSSPQLDALFAAMIAQRKAGLGGA